MFNQKNITSWLSAATLASLPLSSQGETEPRHHFAENNGVKIHYVSAGDKNPGAPVIMIHGFPDYWYTWRKQIAVLSKTRHVLAIDLRGFNKSDKPKGLDNYAIPLLVEDVVAVLEETGKKKAVICGHDWGGMVAWTFAMTHPELTEKLIVLNLPHPHGLTRELATNPQQQKNSAYAREFQKPGAHKKLTPKGLASWVTDADAKEKYLEAFKRSDFEAMLNLYKKNYPRPPYELPKEAPKIKITCPVLLIHGLDDNALLAGALNETWNWIESDLTLVTIPGAGHFVQQDASDLVTRSIASWLNR
jgi:pimeloyl-ACP methyl ester carboxylesterase